MSICLGSWIQVALEVSKSWVMEWSHLKGWKKNSMTLWEFFWGTRWQGLSFGSHAGCYCIFQCPLTFSVSCSCTTWPCWGISFSLRMDLLWGVGTWCWCLEWHLKVNREIIQFLIIEIHCKPIGCFYVVLHAYSQFSFFFLKMYDVLTKLLRRAI